MHELFTFVLNDRNLWKAGELFSLNDSFILQDIPAVLSKIGEIITESDFTENIRNQSVVEIVLTRLTSCLRENGNLNVISSHFLSLLSSCLSYNLAPRDSVISPHAKIASDILSCIFLNSGTNENDGIIEAALPITVKFLHKGNGDLSRSIASYLSLAADKHAHLLAQHYQPIIDSVISGNYGLARVLPLLYKVKKSPFKNHVMTLVSIMSHCESPERLSLISLFAQIAKDSPGLLESSVPQLCEALHYGANAALGTLEVFLSMSSLPSAIPPLSDQMSKFKGASEYYSKAIPLTISLLSAIAKAKPEYGSSTLDYALSSLERCENDKVTQGIVLKEISGLLSRFPNLLTYNVLVTISNYENESLSQFITTQLMELKNEIPASNSDLPFSNCRSMNKLSGSTDNSRLGLYKSLNPLNGSIINMSRFDKSVTCIGKQQGGGGSSRFVNNGTSSPTKSMSSCSMPDHHTILTVNVNQINQDLIRQVSSVLSSKDLNLSRPMTETSGASSISHLSPYSLPNPSNPLPVGIRRHPPYHSSGPIPSCSHQRENNLMAPERSSNLFSNTLPNQRQQQTGRRRRRSFETVTAPKDEEDPRKNRISVFEPYPMRDTVQHFCEKHLDKIKSYMESLSVKLPLPIKCAIEERKGKKHAKLHFACQGRSGEYCLYKSTFYTLKTRNPKIWIHLMFLALQSRSASAMSTREISVSALKNCWEILKCENLSFVALVTGAFPHSKDQDALLIELRSHRFFDVFEYNGPRQHWGCFLCNHPDRATDFIQEQEPVMEGQLKEKKGGKWKIFKKWKSRYFTLSGAKLSYKESVNGENGGKGEMMQSLDVGSIRSVKVSKEGRRNIPKAFEIFTNDRTFILKAKDGSNAQQWVQCLSVAKARSQALDTNLKKLTFGGSLGRLNPHGRSNLFHPSSINSSISLRT